MDSEVGYLRVSSKFGKFIEKPRPLYSYTTKYAAKEGTALSKKEYILQENSTSSYRNRP